MNTLNNQNEINVGVDTGKTQLDIYIRPLDIYFTVENNDGGIKHAIKTLKKHPITRVTIEATGRLEHPFIMACAQANIPFVVANPVNIKRFAGAIGQKAKTDKLDAQLIAHFGEAIKPPLSSLKPEQMRLMSDLLSRRRQLMDMQTMEKNRSQIMPKTISSLIKPILTALKNQIEKVDLKLQKLIKECDEYKVKNDIIQSVPGVGNVVAFNLLSDMPELGCVNNKEAASLVGVAPFNRESGAYQGKRMIRGGRPKIRTAMYMAMMSAIQCNPKFKAIYHRLVAAGKPKKVAIIACIRKLIVIINSMVRDGVMWDPKMV
ncbi:MULTISPECIES: IS110 family transposase [Pseudoalteromonas]|jgi:transposase|uniref:IS110 family transposase n=3 Tax=Pseudoalteromonas TaxID=53246 RepID=A0ABU9TCA7_9GAMM|nr:MULTISPECIES: IS110 family transposase [Pseudoalteromonas]MBB1348317.1 IS110 family transposase [Pseudoalteromonas sp. SG45-2]MBB1404005.1 IS110 family transposase [Pseudoalteromonas sp. SG45-1]MBB1457288.1 IS110 family transposase [Pseudoalteromonas sp. SG43-5]MBD0409248.1 IS110 family transposase [Pseudoalteromonas distincta]MBH0001146.1 IS110 family transposase [Pseudoalteromonas sp. NSLLW24]|tara:strand:+ start:230 stop:1183 length:954 start_codon:yes stop_codon:yes gene_type:complete